VCARVARPAWSCGPSTSPLDVPGSATVSFRARVHTTIAAALLGAYGIWMLAGAVKTYSWPMGAIGAALVLAAVGAVTSWPWSRFLVYAFAAVVTFQWLRFVGPEITSGFLIPYLRGMPLLKAVLVFVPAAIIFLLTGYCCYVAHRYVGNRGGHV
jgi:hypothetical protein